MSVVSASVGMSPGSVSRRGPKVPSAILGMAIFIVTELMFFTGLISSYMVIKSSFPMWAPPGDVVLPVYTTLLNTIILLASGALLLRAGVLLKKDIRSQRGIHLVLWSLAFGTFFVAYQGYEWVGLVSYGMTLKSDIFASCFYLIIGSHALHVAVALIGLGWMYRKLINGTAKLASFQAMQLFWTFVVALWPVLYAIVYFPN
jgi:heme/copper-type cytochrome/quinol oxidase subunit 3